MSDETAPVLVTVPLAVTLDTLKGLVEITCNISPHTPGRLAKTALESAWIAAEDAVLDMPALNADVLAWKCQRIGTLMDGFIIDNTHRRHAAILVDDLRRFGLLDSHRLEAAD